MTENIDTELPSIDRMVPRKPTHPMTRKETLEDFSEMVGETQKMDDLATFLKKVAKENPDIDSSELRSAHNPHHEDYIIEEGGAIKVAGLDELQQKLSSLGVDLKILGVESIGNPNQQITARVQGINPNKPGSGFERPTVAEGPHMILAPYAIDNNEHIHLFRTLQFRTGEAVVDTPRGFADAETLKTGEKMYEVDAAGENVRSNLTRIVGEEAGKKLLKIKKIIYLGSPRVNTSFVTSKSALFGVEVDYDNFVQHEKVISEEEFARRREQLEHEGIVGTIIDMDLTQYIDYKRDSTLSRDLAADSGTDIVVIDYLAKNLDRLASRTEMDRGRLHDEVAVLKELKTSNPEAYEAFKMVREAQKSKNHNK